MTNRSERREEQRRWSRILGEAKRDAEKAQALLSQAQELCNRAAQRVAGHEDAQKAMRPLLEAISAKVRNAAPDVETLRMTARQNETLEEMLLASRQAGEWSIRLHRAAGVVIEAHGTAPAAGLAEIKEIQKAAQSLTEVLQRLALLPESPRAEV